MSSGAGLFQQHRFRQQQQDPNTDCTAQLGPAIKDLLKVALPAFETAKDLLCVNNNTLSNSMGG